MAEVNDADFYRRRERQERKLVKESRDPAIADIHQGLAEHYARLLRSMRKDSSERSYAFAGEEKTAASAFGS